MKWNKGYSCNISFIGTLKRNEHLEGNVLSSQNEMTARDRGLDVRYKRKIAGIKGITLKQQDDINYICFGRVKRLAYNYEDDDNDRPILGLARKKITHTYRRPFSILLHTSTRTVDR